MMSVIVAAGLCFIVALFLLRLIYFLFGFGIPSICSPAIFVSKYILTYLTGATTSLQSGPVKEDPI
jgi:hypothetical protein